MDLSVVIGRHHTHTQSVSFGVAQTIRFGSWKITFCLHLLPSLYAAPLSLSLSLCSLSLALYIDYAAEQTISSRATMNLNVTQTSMYALCQCIFQFDDVTLWKIILVCVIHFNICVRYFFFIYLWRAVRFHYFIVSMHML